MVAETASHSLANKQTQPGLVRLTRLYLCLLLFLLPLKFGVVLNNSEIAFFPLSTLEWLLTPWPPFLLPVLIAPAVLMSSFCGCRKAWFRPQIVLVAAIALLLGASLVGLLKTTERDYAQLFVWHVAGILAMVVAVVLQVNRDPGFRKWALWCMIVGTLFAAYSGWKQAVGSEYKETIDYVRQLQQTSGEELSDEIISRLERGRASGPFVYPNSFAAHVILTLPLVIVAFWQLGKSFSPAWISSPLLGGFATVFAGGALLFTRSRAAMVALVAATLLLLVLNALGSRRALGKALVAGVLVILVGIGALLLINRGRTLSSVGARGDYLQAGLKMFMEEPLTGVGLGEYFPWYMRLKPPGAEEVRVPHNVVILFLAQCGIAGGVAVAAWGLGMFGVFFVGRTCRSGGDPVGWAIDLGGTAWLIHSLVDFNFQIAGTAVTAVTLAALAGEMRSAKADDAEPVPDGNSPWGLAVQVSALVLAVMCFAGVWRWPGEKVYQEFYQAVSYTDVNWETSRPLGERAQRMNPLSPYPGMVMARICMQHQRFPQAISYLEQVLDRAPHRGNLWYLLAQLKFKTGDRDGARAAYRQALLWHNELRDEQSR